jgi:hypothetical protein
VNQRLGVGAAAGQDHLGRWFLARGNLCFLLPVSNYDIGVEAGTDQSEGSFLDGTKSNVAMEGGTGKRKREEGAEVDTQRDGKGKEPAL